MNKKCTQFLIVLTRLQQLHQHPGCTCVVENMEFLLSSVILVCVYVYFVIDVSLDFLKM